MAKTKSSKDRLAQLDEQYVVLSLRGKTRIFGWEPSELHPGKSLPVFSSAADKNLFYAHESVRLPVGDGETKKVPLFKHWLQRATSPRAVGLTLNPNGGRFVNGMVNLWQGFGIEPKPGQWPLLREHILAVVCNGDKEHFSYVIRWIAWVMQNPTLPAEVFLVLQGRKGTGKGWLLRLICRLFGAQGVQISNAKHLTGTFNAHLVNCCLLFSDEALWPGDKSSEGQLKRLATEDTLLAEYKGLDAYPVPNRLSVVMAGNDPWLVPASTDERRFAVFAVSDRRRNDFAHFEALKKEEENGGAAAFLHDMLKLDLAGWHPRQGVPQTEALNRQKIESATDEELWLGGILAEGALPRTARDPATGKNVDVAVRSHPSRARSRALWWHAKASSRRASYFLSEPAFRKWVIEEGIVEGQRDKHSNTWQFPPLPEARRSWNEKRPWWAIEDDGEDWRLADLPGSDAWPSGPEWREREEEPAL